MKLSPAAPATPALGFLSVCAGIEAASEAWRGLDWSSVLLSEIEPFPRAVLNHRHGARDARGWRPGMAGRPLWGDFTALRVRHLLRMGVALPDLLCGGTPCQAFSVAGLRQSLKDARGNLSLDFIRLAHALDNARSVRGLPGLIVVWENVPGVLSTEDNAFGCFLGGLVGHDDAVLPSPKPPVGRSTDLWRWRPERRVEETDDAGEPTGKVTVFPAGHVASWPDAGLVAGPRAWAAWRVLDAQYFGLAQRRRRVFVVAGFRDVIDPAAVLFEPQGLQRHPPARGETGEGVAGTIAGGARRSGGYSNDDIPAVAFGGNNTGGAIDVSPALSAHGGPHGRQDFESEAFITQEVADPLTASFAKHHGSGGGKDSLPHNLIAHALRGEGFDASEDGTGRGAPIVPVHFQTRGSNIDLGQAVTGTLAANADRASGGAPCVAYAVRTNQTQQNGPGYMADLTPALSADEAPAAVAFALRGRDGGAMPEVEGDGDSVGTLRAADGGSSRDYVAFDLNQVTSPVNRSRADPGAAAPTLSAAGRMHAAAASAVRRLTPRECERLQGFPDDHTLIPWRGGMAPDGPRYKALGNSWAVPVARWVGERIAAQLAARAEAA